MLSVFADMLLTLKEVKGSGVWNAECEGTWKGPVQSLDIHVHSQREVTLPPNPDIQIHIICIPPHFLLEGYDDRNTL